MKALPRTPAPGDSCRPRANTTSASGHAADAVGISVEAGVGVVAGASRNTVASKPATANLTAIDWGDGLIERSFMAR
jgi:hypothetical protein